MFAPTSQLRAEDPESPPNRTKPCAIVGVGASAGGLEALEQFFQMAPLDSGMAFVVLQHLSPDFESRMDEILARRTSLPIEEVEDGIEPMANRIYLGRARSEMILSDNRFVLSDRDPDKGFSLPIDNFMRSLAHEIGDRAVAIILSGTGSDGARGIREIYEAGGLVLCQSPEDAAFDGMPRSAVDTGCVHSIGSAQELSGMLLEMHTKRDQMSAAALGTPAPRKGMDRVIDLIRDAHGLDFSQYKPGTVVRRVGRRLAMSSANNIDEYAEQLHEQSGELDAIYRDLLIGVTKFFRDLKAFDMLEQNVIPRLVDQCGPRNELRVWVPGCATGEEAYSLAILLHEAVSACSEKILVKIFATDVHARSLGTASIGCYPAESLEEVSEERRNRYFVQESDNTYRVVPEIRDMVLFARQNVLSNAPFTRVDLVSCRNLLIYFEPVAQRKVISLFHFALRSGGFLFLGPSEAPSQLTEEFQTINGHWKIYRKRRDVRLPIDMRLPLTSARKSSTIATSGHVGGVSPGREQRLLPVYDKLLEHYMPPGILVDDRYQLLHTFGELKQFVRVPKGRANTLLLDFLHPSIRTAVFGALHRAAKTQNEVSYSGVLTTDSLETSRYVLSVRPLPNERVQSLDYLLTFQEIREPEIVNTSETSVDTGELSREYVGSLETELRFAQESLQATVEELETSNEELQASNEELVASNEELQSTNEELHSVNEELHSVNAEHQERIENLRELTDDMDHLLQCIDVGVVFLDTHLQIRRFTRRIARDFRLQPQDVGRSLQDFSHNIRHPSMIDDLNAVLKGGPAIEREVSNKDGESLLMRILPYTSGETIEGVVLTLIDVAMLKKSEADVRRLSAIVDSSGDAIIARDREGIIVSWNAAAEHLFGFAAEEMLGKSHDLFVPEDRREELREVFEKAARGEPVDILETIRRRKDGQLIDVSVAVSPMRDKYQRVFAISAISRDISRRKAAEKAAQRSLEQRDHFLALLSHELRNPLMGILTAGQLLEAGDSTKAARRRATGVIKRQSKHMARLLDDLLDVTRVIQSRIELRKEAFDFREAVVGALDAIREPACAAKVVLDMDIASEPVMAMADPARIQQLIVNLLNNAINYTPSDKRIELEIRRDGDTAIIRVRDEGIGITADMLETIFEPFQQGSAPVREAGTSMGLGLSLVQSIAERHDGHVHVSSPGPGQGSTFTVTIPAMDMAIEAARQPEQPEQPASSEQPEQSASSEQDEQPEPRADVTPCVLLVEDQEENRELLEMALTARGFDVIARGCGADAIAAFRSHQLHAAIVDIGLPDMTGLQVARVARELDLERGHRLPLIALTGHGQEQDREAVMAAGFDAHLVKPVSLDVIATTVTRVMAEAND